MVRSDEDWDRVLEWCYGFEDATVRELVVVNGTHVLEDRSMAMGHAAAWAFIQLQDEDMPAAEMLFTDVVELEFTGDGPHLDALLVERQRHVENDERIRTFGANLAVTAATCMFLPLDASFLGARLRHPRAETPGLVRLYTEMT